MELVTKLFGRRSYRLGIVCFLMCFLFLNALSSVVTAGPEGAQVVNGQVSIQQSGSNTAITASDKAIINYSSFDIAQPETVRFIQPGSNASVLNRILSANPTNINGTLLANGRVFFVNPAGVYIGNGARINVNQLVASGLNISNADFISGSYNFTGGNGAVINNGDISAQQVYLIGKQVTNSGNISCPAGYVVMAAGDRVFLGEPGSDIVLDVEGTPLSDTAVSEVGILNEGTVEAAGGIIALAAAGDIYSQAISNVGSLSTSVDTGDAGQIKLTAAGGEVVNTGTIEASGSEGGQVSMEGARVGQFGTIHADGTSGDGGNVDLTASDVVALSSDSLTTANAGLDGNGGEIIVFSPGTAVAWEGAIVEAKGGTMSGNGGFIETSGKERLFVGDVTVDASAPMGTPGQWLLDPTNVTLSDAATANMGGDPAWVPVGDPATGNIQISAIESVLDDNGGTVTVTTASAHANAGTIFVDDPIDVDLETHVGATTSSLTLNANDSITFDSDAPLTVTSSDNAGDQFTLNLNATTGVVIGADIKDEQATSTIVLTTTGTTFNNTGGNIITNGGAVDIQNTGVVTVGANIDTSGDTGGAISVNGSSVNIDEQLIANNAGISVIASTGDIALADIDNIITAGNGTVTLTATAGDITVDDNTTAAAEIVTTGSVLLTANAIGNAGNKDLDLNGASALTIHDTGAGNIVINEQTESITSTDITVDNIGYGTIDIDYFDTDIVKINDNHEIDTTTLDHDFSYTAGAGDITDKGAVALAGASSFTANGAGGAITLASLEADSAVALDTVGNAVVTNDTALQLAASIVGGTLDVTATDGSISDTGAVAVTGAASFTANGSGGAITLDTLEANSTVTLDTVGNAAVTNDTALQLAASTVGGTLDAVATNGSITDTGALAITGASSFTANGAGGAITLDTLEADGAVALDTVGSAAVTNDTALQLAASDIGGTLDATATDGSISDTDAVAVVGAASFTANGSGGAITLDTLEADNAVTLDTVGNAAVTNDTALQLAASTVGGTLNAAATTDTITDTGALAITGAASFTANGTGGGITLNSLEADDAVALDTVGNAAVTNDTALELAASTVGGTLDAVATNDTITDTGALAITGASSFTANGAGGAITLDTLEADGAVALDTVGSAAVINNTSLQLAASTIGGTLDVTATDGSISDTGAVAVTGAASFTANGAGGAITLNTLEADSTVTLDTVGNAAVTNDTALELVTSTVGGTLDAVATAGTITDTGALSITGASSFTANGAGGGITLDGLEADGAVALDTVGNAVVYNDTSLQLAASNVDGTLDVVVWDGSISDTGTVAVAGAASFNAVNPAGSITLDTLAANDTVSLYSIGNIAVTNDSTLKLINSGTGGTFDITATTGDIEIGGLLTSGDDMKLEAVTGAITQSAGTITTNLGSLTMKSEASLDMIDYTVSNPGTTDLILDSTDGSAIVANSTADNWKSITATAKNNIELQGTDDIKIGGDLTSTSGGVSIISDDGTVITAGEAILDNVTITGYSAAGVGVDLDPGMPGSGEAAIVIRTKEDLTLGSNAELIANGQYDPQQNDDRYAVGFDDTQSGGDPIDVAIYLRSNRTDAVGDPIGNVAVNSKVTIADSGTMVVDAGEEVTFGGKFNESDFNQTKRLEVVSRRSETLDEVINNERLPYAKNPEAIRDWFNETSTGYFAGAYVLRGVKTLLAEVLALTNPVPLVPPRTLEPEFRGEVQGPDTEALEKLLSDLGIGVQPYMTEAYADSLSTDLRLYKAAEKLQELMPILEDANGIHIAGLRETAAEYFPTLDVLSEERMDSFAQVLTSHKGDGTDYDLAGQCIFALIEYVNILDTDIGWPVETSVEFVMGRYVPRLTENDEIRIAVIQMHLQKGL